MAHKFETLANIFAPVQLPPMLLAAIWLNEPIVTGSGENRLKSRRMAPGVEVLIENGTLKSLEEGKEPTHVIVKCFGGQYGPFDLTARELISNEVITIKL